MAFVEPNLYVLSGGGIHVTYSTTGINGQPHLTYSSPSINHTFTGTQIQTEQSPLGIVGDPSDIAHTVLFLAGQAARFVTGQVLRTNGGVGMPW